MSKDSLNGLTLGVIDDYPEWKHSVLKFVARMLFLKRTNYVILVHTIETKDDDGRRTGTSVP
jgi:hypothetical protein